MMADAPTSPVEFKMRKVKRIVIFEDRCGDWRIRLYFDKGPHKVLGETYDTHNHACLGASGISLKQTWALL